MDRLAIVYISLPLFIFLIGWFELWAAAPLALCAAYSLRALTASLPRCAARAPLSGLQLIVAAAVGCAWSSCGGTGHWVFANADWHIRDAVLHDLVVGRWPISYGALHGGLQMLRAPLGYYLPAALIGKAAGLVAAHAALALWTAAGATLFLLQVLSRVPPRPGPQIAAAAVVVLFSGLDVIGTLLRSPGLIAGWDFTGHLEWWARDYQYSSMTTQLFWVPNHALGGWLTIGLLLREPRRDSLEPLLPVIVAAVALWSPLTALGVVPFVLWRLCATAWRERSLRLADPRLWVPALAVGVPVAAYLTLDAGRIPHGWVIGRAGGGFAAATTTLAHHAEFFLLEAGLIGVAVWSIRRSSQVAIALGVLALLPFFSFGASNDFVMRASIPSLTVLAVGACFALTATEPSTQRVKKAALIALLTLGAVTPLQEIARALVRAPWPINLDSTLVDVSCGKYYPHYIARLGDGVLARVLRPPHALAVRAADAACVNFAGVPD